MEEKTFACAINCMDGRVQDAVKNYVKEKYNVDYMDVVTEAGPNKILAENADAPIIANIKKRVGISFHHHGSKVLAIAAHHGCAGNPVTKDEQLAHLRQAKKTAEGFGFEGEIILLWVDETWKASKVE